MVNRCLVSFLSYYCPPCLLPSEDFPLGSHEHHLSTFFFFVFRFLSALILSPSTTQEVMLIIVHYISIQNLH